MSDRIYDLAASVMAMYDYQYCGSKKDGNFSPCHDVRLIHKTEEIYLLLTKEDRETLSSHMKKRG